MDLQASRERLFESLRREISDRRVLSTMERVPRELFVPPEQYHLAYEDIPLSIGYGQTISQPFIVALMTQALELQGNEKVLEIGTGSGYQTAILAELSRWVVSVERIPELADSAKKLLDRLGYRNVEIHVAREILGWPEKAPYDAIIVTAGAPQVPNILLEQLSTKGKMVIPVGSRWEQDLLKVSKKEKRVVVENLGGCRFVPLISKDAWED